ncbi:MAG: HAMP domain-containing protein, partial [Candidatus Riflebacteria bacterium]|nr:HAMP domain-containing protein [Candidatus Riflebacteria bacterium]
GYEFKKLDSKLPGISAYSLNTNSYEKASNLFLEYEAQNKQREKNEIINKNDSKKIFSLGNVSKIPEHKKLSWLIGSIMVLLFIFILIGFNIVFSTTKTNLKTESYNECFRLIEQLKSGDVLKSAFETLCYMFYKDIDDILKSKNILLKEDIEKITNKYESLGCPIPRYYCCYIKDNKILDNYFSTKNFSPKASKAIGNYALSWIKHPKSNLDSGKKRVANLKEIMKDSIRDDDLTSAFYRRSALSSIEGEDIYIDTNKLFDYKTKKYTGYVFCGMPKNYNEIPLTNYYTLLSGNSILLAIKNKNGWYFSNNFTEKEKKNLINTNSDNIKEKGYIIESIDINNEPSVIYAIKKDLLDNINSNAIKNYFIIFSLFIICSFIIIYLKKKKYLLNPTVATKLKLDILISSVLPIITVIFVSYLYINEDFNVKKSETRYKLNKLMDDIEEREYYYIPLCESIIKDFANSKSIKENAFLANKEIDKNKKNKITPEIRERIDDFCQDGYYLFNEKIDPHFNIREIVIVGKNDWVSAEIRRKNQNGYDKNTGLSQFGKVLVEIAKTVYFNKNKGKSVASEAKGAIIVEKVLKSLNSIFGNLFTIKLTSFPNNINYVTVTYSTVAVYVATVYSDNDYKDLEYVLFALVFFDNDLKPRICSLRNEIFSLKFHIASGAKTKNLYSFYSPNLEVGKDFFYNYDSQRKNILNEKEDFETLKELGFISSYINTSYLPVSISTKLHGKHLIEARQGYKISDNIYAALVSEYPIKMEAFSNLPTFASVIIFSIILIFLIVQTIINDLLLPVKRLMEGAKSVEKGDYSFRTEFFRGDELGALCDSFDKMLKGLEEKQLMNRMVSKTALSVASGYSETTSKKENIVLLYIAVPQFDIIMNSTSPDNLFEQLKKQIATISEIIINAGGDIDKIIGEKLLIAFHINNTGLKEASINAARIAHQIATNDNLCFNVGVGVNCGQVISGYLGVGEKRDFTIIGDPVNVAARIESLAEKLDNNRCLISETLYEQISEQIDAKLYGEVELKGKSQPMKVYRLF